MDDLVKMRKRISELEKTLSQCNRMVRELRDSQKWLKMLFEYAPDPFYLVDLKGTFVDGNKAAEKVSGYKKEELIGKNFLKLKLLSPQQISKAASLLARNAMGQPTGPDEFIFNRKNGKKIILQISTFPVKIKDKTLVIGIARDITEQKRAQEMLQASEEKYRTLVENIADALLQIDPKGKITYMSKSFEKKIGYSREEVKGKNIRDLLTPESYRTALKRIRRWMKGAKGLSSYEVEVKSKDGRIIPFELNTSPLIEEGKLKAIQVIARDITERKQAEEETRRSYKKLQKILQGTINALASVVEVRDPYTAGHQKRVTNLACAIAKEMGLPEEKIEGIRVAGTLHDIGKIHLPSEILSKPARLNEMETGLLQTHPRVSYEILKEIEFPWPVAKIILQHHERMNGSGYPQGLSGDEILLEARILAVADVVEAMSSHRPYRPALGIDKALEHILKNRGTLYDPQVVDACLRLLTRKKFNFDRPLEQDTSILSDS